MYKFIGLAAIILGSIGLGASLAKAGLFDDIKTAITGHVDDAKGRVFGSDEFINGATIKSGTFDETADGRDLAHWADGTARLVIKDGVRYIQLDADFNSGPLPDGHVYVSVATDINNEDDFFASTQIDLGPLKLGKGASYYELPAGTLVNSVTIWCQAFSEYIGSADVS